jgi:hypothetical protein
MDDERIVPPSVDHWSPSYWASEVEPSRRRADVLRRVEKTPCQDALTPTLSSKPGRHDDWDRRIAVANLKSALGDKSSQVFSGNVTVPPAHQSDLEHRGDVP